MNEQKQRFIEILDKLDNILDYHNKNLTKHQYNTLDEAREILLEELKKMED
jgi:hypothetical protein